MHHALDDFRLLDFVANLLAVFLVGEALGFDAPPQLVHADVVLARDTRDGGVDLGLAGGELGALDDLSDQSPLDQSIEGFLVNLSQVFRGSPLVGHLRRNRRGRAVDLGEEDDVTADLGGHPFDPVLRRGGSGDQSGPEENAECQGRDLANSRGVPPTESLLSIQ